MDFFNNDRARCLKYSRIDKKNSIFDNLPVKKTNLPMKKTNFKGNVNIQKIGQLYTKL